MQSRLPLFPRYPDALYRYQSRSYDYIQVVIELVLRLSWNVSLSFWHFSIL